MARERDGKRVVGVVLFEGFELLDVYGPLEMWSGLSPYFRIEMLGPEPGPIAGSGGPETLARQSYAHCEPLDVLLVPGGQGTRREVHNEELLAWLRERAAEAEIVASVCTGSALLAKAGLLDGRRATSNKRAFEWVKAQGPRVKWVAEARWVEDGKFITASGVSAGMDMALALLAKLRGVAVARAIADAVEYAWHDDPSWDPYAKIHGAV